MNGMTNNSDYILEIKDVTKRFPGVIALDRVNLNVVRGEIHGVVGENGAGKSTLMKILSGVHPSGTYQGHVMLNGEEVAFKNSRDAGRAGIGIVHQELMLVQDLSIAENIHLGHMAPIVNWNDIYRSTRKLTSMLGLNEDPRTLVKDLGLGKQQLVEIAKVLSRHDQSILILDEPTSALIDTEIEHLFRIMRQLKSQGVTCIYISHKLGEIFEICDRVSVLRDGKSLGTYNKEEIDERTIITKMVGRKMENRFPERILVSDSEDIFCVKDLTVTEFNEPQRYLLKEINFCTRAGEILGIAGLMGSGRSELVNTIFGNFQGTVESGEIYVEGRRTKIKKPIDAINAGIGLVTEDRKLDGLNLLADVEKNMTMASLKKFSRLGVMNHNIIQMQCDEMSEKVKVKTPSLKVLVNKLSGGNQQKVILSKWLLANPKILIIDEPTRGIDVGAKFEIYCIMNELKQSGMSIIMISSELPEILAISDRVIVLCNGTISGRFDNNEKLTAEIIMEKAIGGKVG